MAYSGMPRTRRRMLASMLIALVAVALVLITVFTITKTDHEASAGRAVFVGAATCASCHKSESASWKPSQHALAMQDAKGEAVLGRFDSTAYTSGSVTSTFFRRDNRYFVNTDDEDGALHDYEIRWTFGVYPLQQYLVELSNGRVQALTTAWDSRPKEEGGQRWFSLNTAHGASSQDRLHWTGRRYNWNYTCSDCHSTALRKGYDERTNQYRTTFAELNVACEACHGPGSRHVEWARYPSLVRKTFSKDPRLNAQLTERRGVSWSTDARSGFVHRSMPRKTDREIEVCAQCHARRLHIAEGYTAGARMLDFYVPVILGEMYYPDGQQKDEVYNYGSFLQSRMYAAGVTCSDCHDPHTGKLRLPGNNVCTQCHVAAKYDTGKHHHHIIAGTTGTCTSCHMPTTTYMDIDPRHDHSMRIPRPDLTVSIGVPNACNACHAGKSSDWAAAQIRTWYPNPVTGYQDFEYAFFDDDARAPRAAVELAHVATTSTEPWFVRASALARLAGRSDPVALAAARARARDPRPFVRLAALQVAEGFGSSERLELAIPMLSDSTRAVRQGAAWILSPVASLLRSATDRRAFNSASAEFMASQRYNADQPGSHIVLGVFFMQRNQLDSAEAEFRAARRMEPRMSQADSGLAAVARMRAAGSTVH